MAPRTISRTVSREIQGCGHAKDRDGSRPPGVGPALDVFRGGSVRQYVRTVGMDMSARVPVRQILDGLAKAPPSRGKGRERFTTIDGLFSGQAGHSLPLPTVVDALRGAGH